MARSDKIHTLFKAGDGRIASEHVVSIRPGWQARLFSEGWDCDGDGGIVAWYIPMVPANECEDAIAVPYLERCTIDCCSTVDVPKLSLTKNRTFDIITDVGTYVLQRQCEAEDVTVYIQYKKLE